MKKYLTYTIIISLTLSAIFGILTFLFGDFGELELRIIGTTFFTGIFALAGLAGYAAYEKQTVPYLGLSCAISAALSFIFTELAVWELVDFYDVWKPVLTLAIITYALAHLCLLIQISHYPKHKILTIATGAGILGLAFSLLTLIIGQFSYYSDTREFMTRFLGISSIIAAVGTIILPILNKLGSKNHAPTSLSTVSDSLISTGTYEHYKGKKYNVLGTAKHSETLEDLVVYECLYDNPQGKLWVRPLKMFTEEIEVNGQKLPRFKKISH